VEASIEIAAKLCANLCMDVQNDDLMKIRSMTLPAAADRLEKKTAEIEGPRQNTL
jgi:hypothetical protein